jgi:predicted ATPase
VSVYHGGVSKQAPCDADRGTTVLSRLKVSGFKNLLDVDVAFGPFTCIAGPNGVGKSNLLDAIRFLSLLADRPLIEAALHVRGESERLEDAESLIHQAGANRTDRMTFEAEMLIPLDGLDDLGQPAKASATFLRYRLDLGLRRKADGAVGPFEVLREELLPVPLKEATAHLRFPGIAPKWRASVLRAKERSRVFIATEGAGAERAVELHSERNANAAPVSRIATNLPRTVLSSTDATTSPTAFLARSEMRSWQVLHLEPASLRRPAEAVPTPSRILGADGSHLPTALYRVVQLRTRDAPNEQARRVLEAQVYAEVANRLATLVDDIRTVSVVRDEERRLLTLYVTDRTGASYPARSLSDGSLRFLALVILSLTPDGIRVLCLEEPENGIAPDRIPALLGLLHATAVDAMQRVDAENPLRQVILTTHSPAVVALTPDDSLLVAERRLVPTGNGRSQAVSFAALPGTWRLQTGSPVTTAPLGSLLPYLSVSHLESDDKEQGDADHAVGSIETGARRVADREDVRRLGLVALTRE